MEKGIGRAPQRGGKRVKSIRVALLLLAVCSYSLTYFLWSSTAHTEPLPLNAAAILAQCSALHLTPGPPDDFYARTQSDRFVEGTPATLVRNASIWTGLDEGNEIVSGDILIDKGIIQKVGSVDQKILDSYPNVVVVDAAGSWVSPGCVSLLPCRNFFFADCTHSIVDLHSHLGVGSSPSLSGARDTNSHKGLMLPWLRSLVCVFQYSTT